MREACDERAGWAGGGFGGGVSAEVWDGGPEIDQELPSESKNQSKLAQNTLTALSFWADFGPLTRVEDPLKRSPKIGLRRVWGRVFGLGPIEIAKACVDHER